MLDPFREEVIAEALSSVFDNSPVWLATEFRQRLLTPKELLTTSAQTILKKPYGTNALLWIREAFGLSFVCFEPGQRTSVHYHAMRREFFFVRAGVLSLEEGDSIRSLAIGEWGMSSPMKPHSLLNRGYSWVEVLEVFSPPLVDDKVRLSDPYNRRLGAVEHRE